MTPTNNTPTAALWYNPIQKQFLKIQLGDGSNLNGDTDANGREYDAYTLLGIFGCPAELEEAVQKGQLEGEIDIDQELELNGIDCPLLKDGGMQLWFKEEMPAIDSEEMLRTAIQYMAHPSFLEAALYMSLTGNVNEDDLRLHTSQHRQADD